MTVKELSQLYWLNREVEMCKKRLAALEAELKADCAELERLRASLDGLHSMNTDGMPHGSGVGNPVESTVMQIMALEEVLRGKHDALMNLKALISARQTVIVLERDRLERYISAIGDPYMRQIFTLRFVDGLSWQQVAVGIGRQESAESTKQICYRYLRKHC